MFQKTFTPAILAGICISIGCVVNLRVGGVAGAVLFAFGLTTVVYYGLKLYTGTAGFIRRQGDWSMLLTVLFGNIIGCLLTAWLIAYAQPDCVEPAAKILAGRLAKGPWTCFLLAIGCGFIMTTAVEFARTPLPTPSISSFLLPTSYYNPPSPLSMSARYLVILWVVISTVG